MPDEHLRSDEDVEQILRIAVKMPGGAGSTDLRSRLNEVAEELGITPEQLAEAERQYAAEKDHAQAMQDFVKEQRASFFRDLLPYLGFNAFFFYLDWKGDHQLNWVWYPLFIWGAVIVGQARRTFFTKSEAFAQDFVKWKKRRDRKRNKKALKDEALSVAEAGLGNGIHIALGTKVITPRLEVSDISSIQSSKDQKADA